MSNDEVLGRRRPVLVLVMTIGLLLVHHWWVNTRGEAFFFALLILPPLAAVAIAGIVHPPLYYTMTPHGKTLPTTTKILTGVIALVGLACGLLIWSQLYTFPNPYAP